MKPTALQAALDAQLSAANEIDQIKAFGEATTLKLAEARAAVCLADLQDKGRIGKIIELEAVAALLPGVVKAREEAWTVSDEKLIAATNDYIRQTHCPRVRAFRSRAEAKVREDLVSHFTDPNQLARAVEQSALVVEASNLDISASAAPVFGAIRFAEAVLDQSTKADGFEKKLP